MSAKPFASQFDLVHDTIVIGTGYAAYAAALSLKRQGQRVLLVGSRGDLLEESGRRFARPAGQSDAALWRELTGALSAVGAANGETIEGALAELTGVKTVLDAKLPVLFYVQPVAVERDAAGLLQAVVVATKSGCRRLAAKRWIDATESGLLAGLCAGAALTLKTPAAREFNLFYESAAWPAELDAAALTARVAEASWLPTTQASVRCLSIAVAPGGDGWSQVKAAAGAAHALWPEALAAAVMSHCSLEPYDRYAAGAAPLPALPANLSLAVPGLAAGAVATLADRLELGLGAATQSQGAPGAAPTVALLSQPLPDLTPTQTRRTQVLVAGAGTGGAVAAIAAARGGAQTICVDPLAFPGGIGAGGGIHWYYFGVSGGLQEEIDQRILAGMDCFASKAQVRGFHPDMKKLTLLEMFAEAGVQWVAGAMVYGAERAGRKVTAAWIATDAGPLRVEAANWIDSTGDADLCAMAGASTWMGREGDGQVHAYSQSIGRVAQTDKGALMIVTNFDAGWTDPTDPEDLTRARLEGIRQYLRDDYTELRPTYIAPAIGLRQSRHVHTDYELTLADLIEGRSFPDTIGYTGSHYDNHAVDMQFESDEGLFWVWGCEQWRTRTRCEMPYRMLLPRDLDNVWVACRAAGVSPDAHHSFRMQRDMQRLGETAGLAAALTVGSGADARGVDQKALKASLMASGALNWEEADHDHDFGPLMSTELYQKPLDAEDREAALTALRDGKFSPGMWQLYRHRAEVEAEVLALLDGGDPLVSWYAAMIVAMWGDARAEKRLLQALDTRESGADIKKVKYPEWHNRVAPFWAVAVAMLRICGTRACLPSLGRLGREEGINRPTRTLVATTLERLLERGVANAADVPGDLLSALVRPDYRDRVTTPQTKMPATPDETLVTPASPGNVASNARWDFDWQLHLVVGRIRKRLGLPLHAEAEALLADDRALVRRAGIALAG